MEKTEKIYELRKQLCDFKKYIEGLLPDPHSNLNDVNVAYLKGRLDTINDVILMLDRVDRLY